MIEFLKRQMTRTKRFYTYNKKTVAIGSLFTFLMFLSLYPMIVQIDMADAYGNVLNESSVLQCAGTQGNYNINGIEYINKSDCLVYFNITTYEYSIKTPKVLVYFDEPNTHYELQRADKRYRVDNPKRWKPYDLSNKWLPNDTVREFRMFIYKPLNETIKFGIKSGLSDFDPILAGYGTDDFFVELIEHEADLTKGYAEFVFNNPLNKDIEVTNKTLRSLYTVIRGEVLSEQYSFYSDVKEKIIKVDKTTCVDNYVLKTIIMTNNETGLNESVEQEINEPICTTKQVDEIKPEYKISTKLDKVIISKSGNLTMRIDLIYTPNTIVDWEPEFEIESVKFKQEKW